MAHGGGHPMDYFRMKPTVECLFKPTWNLIDTYDDTGFTEESKGAVYTPDGLDFIAGNFFKAPSHYE